MPTTVTLNGVEVTLQKRGRVVDGEQQVCITVPYVQDTEKILQAELLRVLQQESDLEDSGIFNVEDAEVIMGDFVVVIVQASDLGVVLTTLNDRFALKIC